MNVWPLVSRPACDEPAAGSLEQHLDDAGERSFAAQHCGGSLAPISVIRGSGIETVGSNLKETFPATPADSRVDQEAAIHSGLYQLTSARRVAPLPLSDRRCQILR
jgi:hypothetical protein